MSGAYEREGWDDYAVAFQSVMPSLMTELNQAVARRMYGDVIDFGCGAAKIAPFVLEVPEVRSYTGLDYAPAMVERARWILGRFPCKPGRILEGRIEDFGAGGFDSALSINSYYAWDAPLRTLEVIYRSLVKGGTFVLATPNPSIDMARLLAFAEKEMVAHPHWETFKIQNLAFCDNQRARFVLMDDFVAQVRSVGFGIIEANQRFYLGGINFLVLHT